MYKKVYKRAGSCCNCYRIVIPLVVGQYNSSTLKCSMRLLIQSVEEVKVEEIFKCFSKIPRVFYDGANHHSSRAYRNSSSSKVCL